MPQNLAIKKTKRESNDRGYVTSRVFVSVVVVVSLLAMYLLCKWEILKYVFLLMEDLEFQAEKLKFNFINVASF